VKTPVQKRDSSLIKATIFTALTIAILVALGVWQLNRKVWKEDLIDTLNIRLAQSPEKLPPSENWRDLTQANDEFRPVTSLVEFLPDSEAFVYTAGSTFRPDVQGAGYWVFAPARLIDGSIVVVNRGFIPFDRKDLISRANGTSGVVQITGVMRWPERQSLFMLSDDPKSNVWYARNLRTMAMAKHWGTMAPFYIDQESPIPPGGWPKPGKLQVILPNNHLQYAMTWFGLALALAGVYGFWLMSRLRQR
jgi:surfeit locus 1 family protein